jgi:hypothetical protein
MSSLKIAASPKISRRPSYGGAINAKSDFTAINCSFGANEAEANGGAIDMYYYIPDPNTRTLEMTLTMCTFADNKAGNWGGAVHAQNFEGTFNQCYFINNTAWSGGAVHLSEGIAQIGNSLFSGNTQPACRIIIRAVTGARFRGRTGMSQPAPRLSIPVFVETVPKAARARWCDCPGQRQRDYHPSAR